MTYIDPPTSYRLTVRDIPPRLRWDFKETCKGCRIGQNDALIRLMELMVETDGKVLDRLPDG